MVEFSPRSTQMRLKSLTLCDYNVTGKDAIVPTKTTKRYWGSGAIVPLIITLDLRYRREVSLTPRTLDYQERIPRGPFHSRQSKPQGRSGRCGEDQDKLCASEFEPDIIQPTA